MLGSVRVIFMFENLFAKNEKNIPAGEDYDDKCLRFSICTTRQFLDK